MYAERGRSRSPSNLYQAGSKSDLQLRNRLPCDQRHSTLSKPERDSNEAGRTLLFITDKRIGSRVEWRTGEIGTVTPDA